jgi:hypothetical protein
MSLASAIAVSFNALAEVLPVVGVGVGVGVRLLERSFFLQACNNVKPAKAAVKRPFVLSCMFV